MSVAKFRGVDKDVGESGDGGFVFGVSFEDFGGIFDFFVISREGLFDEFKDIVGRGGGELRGVYLHCKIVEN